MVGASFGSKGAYLSVLSTMLVVLCGTIPADIVSAQETVLSVDVENGDTIFSNYNVSQGDYFTVEVECQSCETVLYLNGQEIDRDFITSHGMVNTSGILNLTITSNIQDKVNYAVVADISDMNIQSRPSPQQEVNLLNPHTCKMISQCIDFSQEQISTNSPNNLSNSEHYSKGVLDSQSSEYISIPVMGGESLELNLLHSTADLEIDIYYQNDTIEEPLGRIIDYDTPKSLFLSTSSEFLYFDDSGRIIVKLSSETSETLWILQHIIHSKINNEVINVSQTDDIFGHGEMDVVMEVTGNTALVIQSPNDNLNVTYWSLFEGQWVLLKQQQSILESHYIYSLPESTAVKLEFIGNMYTVALSTDDYSDINSGLEAPSVPPMNKDTDNSSWPVIDITKSINNGQFTTSINDISDVYAIEIEAWEDSIHFLKFSISGDIANLEVELISKNQETWEDIETKTRQYSQGKLEVALEVPRGTHYLRVTNLANISQGTWGDYQSPLTYTIETTYELVEEGEEPWFPPDENAEKWGSVARWIMGFFLLTPAAYLVYSHKRNQGLANEMRIKKQRLEFLKQRLDSGKTPQSNRKLITRSLTAISMLDWEDACAAWGPAEANYRTENIAIAAWKLDERIAKNTDAWPIIVGINVIKGNWDICALRLDSPEGQAWNVRAVTPKFLFAGEEVFLDTMVEGNKTFLSLEISSTSNAVDIEINGRLDGTPSASRIPSTIYREIKGEE